MVERQPGRPSEREFIEAACRFLNDNYEDKIPQVAMFGFFAVCDYIANHRVHDISVIESEQQADGLRGTPESLEEFAVRQLAMYQKLKKPK